MKNYSFYRFISFLILVTLVISTYGNYSIASAAPAPLALTEKTINLAWFYKPPANGDLSSLAQNYSTFILTRNDETQRDTLFNSGVSAPILQYIRFEAIQDPGSCTTAPRNNQAAFKVGDFCDISQNHADWFLLDAQGNRIANDTGYYLMDPGNQGWRDYLLARIQESQDGRGWFGVFLDNVEGSRSKYERKNTSPAKYPDDASYQVAIQGLLEMLYTSYFQPQGRPLMANIIETSDNATWFNYLQYLDGAMEESWAVDWSSSSYLSETKWLENLAMAEQIQNNGKYAILISQGSQTDTARQNFAFASYLLISNGRAAFRYTNSETYNQNWLYDNYNTTIGSPLGGRYQSGGLWKRDFTNGVVSVDPINHTATIQLGSPATSVPTSQPTATPTTVPATVAPTATRTTVVTPTKIPATATMTATNVVATPTKIPATATPKATQTLDAQSTTYDSTYSGFKYTSGWQKYSEKWALNGSYMRTKLPQESIEFTFTGTSFSILYSTDINQGILDVYVDGVLVGSLNQKATLTRHKLVWNYSGPLTQGQHKLKLILIGPTGKYGTFDGLIVYK